jgi:ferredoxin-NADP reductase
VSDQSAVPVPRNYRAVLRRALELAPDTKHLEWEVVEGGAFEFVAGQFVSLTLKQDGHSHTRAYSIASPPRGDNRFELCLNRVPGGQSSNYLCDLEPGAVLEINGPHGYFNVRYPIENDVVFVATGTGLAPIRSMLADLLASEKLGAHQAWLLFGTRTEQSILYRDELESWARAHGNFHFVPTLTRPGPEWRGKTGRVQERLRELFQGRKDMTAYICGLRAMVDDVRRMLREEWGWERARIRSEKYD